MMPSQLAVGNRHWMEKKKKKHKSKELGIEEETDSRRGVLGTIWNKEKEMAEQRKKNSRVKKKSHFQKCPLKHHLFT